MLDALLQLLLGQLAAQPQVPPVLPTMTHEAMMAQMATMVQLQVVAQQQMTIALARLVVYCFGILWLLVCVVWAHLIYVVNSAYRRGYEATLSERAAPASTGKILGV